DASGIATVALSSGTVAQAVQVRAQVRGTGIFSEQASVAIHGGLPDASICPAALNIPGLVYCGLIDSITALAGDRYAKPVPAANVVYFTTACGVIQGSAAVDDHGRARVDLATSGCGPARCDSDGFVRVSGQTIGENGV